MDKYPIAARSLERPYHIDGDQFERQYKEHLSGYLGWSEREHADRWLVFPENVGERLSVDETSLSNGELYTVVTNKAAKGRKGAIVAIVSGTDSGVVLEALKRIPMAADPDGGTPACHGSNPGHGGVDGADMQVSVPERGEGNRPFPRAETGTRRGPGIEGQVQVGCHGPGERADKAGETLREGVQALREGVQARAPLQRRHPQAAPLPQSISPLQVPGEMDGVAEDQGEAPVRHIPRHRPGILPVSQTEADLLQDKNQGRGLHETGKVVQRGPEVWNRHIPHHRGDDIQPL